MRKEKLAVNSSGILHSVNKILPIRYVPQTDNRCFITVASVLRWIAFEHPWVQIPLVYYTPSVPLEEFQPFQPPHLEALWRGIFRIVSTLCAEFERRTCAWQRILSIGENVFHSYQSIYLDTGIQNLLIKIFSHFSISQLKSPPSWFIWIDIQFLFIDEKKKEKILPLVFRKIF